MKWKDLPAETAERFDLPADAVAGMPKLTITGKARVLIENHKGLIEYGRELVEVNGGRVRIRVHGGDLELRAMNQDDLVITGAIVSVEFI